MIINVKGQSSQTDDILKFEIPSLYFDRKYSYKIGLVYLYFELKPTTKNSLIKENDLICLSSNLIDRSSANTMQSLCQIVFQIKKQFIQYTKPTMTHYYPLHLYEFGNAKFDLNLVYSGSKIEIDKIFLQLDIIKIDPYGRVKSIGSTNCN